MPQCHNQFDSVSLLYMPGPHLALYPLETAYLLSHPWHEVVVAGAYFALSDSHPIGGLLSPLGQLSTWPLRQPMLRP